MSHVSPQTFPISKYVPYLHSAIMTGRQEQVTVLRKELDLLNSLVVAHPCMKPLLGDEKLMLFLSQIGGWLYEAFPAPIVCINTMEYGGRLVYFGLFELPRLCIIESFLPFLFKLGHELFLVLGQLRLLSLELLHALVDSPWSLEIPRAGIILSESLLLQLLPVGLPALGGYIPHVGVQVYPVDEVGVDELLAGCVGGVDGVAEGLEVVVLLVEAARVQVDLLDDTGEVVLLGNQLVLRLEAGLFLHVLVELEVLDVDFRGHFDLLMGGRVGGVIGVVGLVLLEILD